MSQMFYPIHIPKIIPVAVDEDGDQIPLEISVNMYIQELGNLDIKHNDYEVTMYMRQEWNDPR